MKIAGDYVIDCYKPIAMLNEEHNVTLVQHIHTKNVFVMKKLTVYNPPVYEALQRYHIKGTPEVIEVIESDGELTVIEEYISGETLRSILDNGNRFSSEQTIKIMTKLCEILKQMHDFSPAIVHRDIKPSNIIITADNEVKLLDMNAAKFVSANTSKDTTLLGTVGYAAPEQYGFGASGVQADIFSLGKVMTEMLTGRPDAAILRDRKLSEIVEKCTKMDPKDRYDSVDELIHDLNPNMSVSLKKDHSFLQKMRFPGFRSGNPQNMAIAFVGYVLLFGIALTMSAEAPFEWLERFFFVTSGLSVIFLTSNYLGIWKVFRVDRIKRPMIKSLVIAILAVVAALLIIILMVMIENILK